MALVIGGGAVATVVYLRKRSRKEAARASSAPAREAPFADFNDPVELRPRPAAQPSP